MIRRSAAVAVAVTLHQLIAGKTSGWTPDQKLVIAALRRSAARLHGASDAELGDYLRPMSSVQVQGVASNVKGILHEMLVMQAENADGDDILAQIFEATNHPGADLEFVMDGDVVGEVQLKAVQDPGAIIEHFSRYPDIEVLATSEAYRALGGLFGDSVADSGISNVEITQLSRATIEELAGDTHGAPPAEWWRRSAPGSGHRRSASRGRARHRSSRLSPPCRRAAPRSGRSFPGAG